MAALVEYRARRDPSIDLTPLIDVVFQLLLFFMVSAQFARPHAHIELPLGRPGPPPPLDWIRVEVAATGALALDGQPVDDAEFVSRLRTIAETRGIRRVQFHADRRIDYGRFIDLIERACDAGIEGFALVKRPAPDAPSP